MDTIIKTWSDLLLYDPCNSYLLKWRLETFLWMDQSFPSLLSRTRYGESLSLKLVSDSVLLYRVEPDSESDSNFPLWEAQAWNLAILWGLSKYRVSRSKTRLGLGLGLVILEGTRLGIGLGIVEVSCKVSDSESRLENSDPGNSEMDIIFLRIYCHHRSMVWMDFKIQTNQK